MRYLVKQIMLVLSLCLGLSLAYAKPRPVDRPVTKEEQMKMTPKMVLDRLKAGNQRFVKNDMKTYDYTAKREVSADSQHPIAVVLSCVDSRSVPDLLFDQGLGNMFVARVAGNVASQEILGSEEFATKFAGAKVVVVMGHTSCGVVQGSCKGVGEGNLRALLNNIAPAIYQSGGRKNCESMDYVNKIAKQNVINQVIATYEISTTIKKLVDEDKIMLVGAMHDLGTGKVDFFYEFKPADSKV
jgi:carbonic anhydrase